MVAPAKPLFKLGEVVATPNAIEAMQESNQDPMYFLRKHLILDPGELSEEDQETNHLAVRQGDRIFSAYKTKLGVSFGLSPRPTAVQRVSYYQMSIKKRQLCIKFTSVTGGRKTNMAT